MLSVHHPDSANSSSASSVEEDEIDRSMENLAISPTTHSFDTTTESGKVHSAKGTVVFLIFRCVVFYKFNISMLACSTGFEGSSKWKNFACTERGTFCSVREETNGMRCLLPPGMLFVTDFVSSCRHRNLIRLQVGLST